ncbi:MAG: LysM peptidoglycan-binding domain-containing protein [Bacteroidota bacterium]
MKAFSRFGRIFILACACVSFAYTQELSKEDWQKQVTDLTTRRNDLKNKLTALQTEVANLQKQDADKSAALKKCQDEMTALAGSTEAPFVAQLDKIDARLNELSRLSNQDLWARRAEVDSVQSWLDSAKKNALAVLPKYATRIADEQGRVDALRKTLQQVMESGEAMQTYTVGTWARDRDCLWNIAKKPKVYDNAFLWPKIWQGNRDQIKDPDVIQPGQRLKIPPKAELTSGEKSALRSYWSKKQK